MSCKQNAPSEVTSPIVQVLETEEGYKLMRNGEPFYIKGAAAHPAYLKELREAGANTARIYDTINLNKTLDTAEKLGLAVVVDIPMPQFHTDPEYYENEILFHDMKQRIHNLVERHKDHTALLYWNLGNELYYPYLYRITDFYKNYNSLIDLIHELDPNHPVSTTTIGANKLLVLSIITRSPQLDFISFNSFGVLSQFSKKLDPIAAIWNGPHVISEWGVNGPWEADVTMWKAPIEETSTKKAEQISQRYKSYIEPLKQKNSFGSFIFYWGAKDEVTPSWYSLFGDDRMKSEAVFELSNIWKDQQKTFPGPRLNYLLLNEKGAAESITLLPESEAMAEVDLPETEKDLSFCWELRYESWNERLISKKYLNVDFQLKDNRVTFTTPNEEGPYRLFVYLTNGSEYYATANIPFYVLKPVNED